MSISQPVLPSVSSPVPSPSRNPTEATIWKLTLAYDGTDFQGWQIQARDSQKPTIQGTLADAIAVVTGEQVLPQGSGRTDAGVHAEAQVVSFPLASPIPPENLHRALNRALPASIRILAAEHAPPGFHARHSALGKIYRYRIFNGPVCSPFLARYVTRSRSPLDFVAMQEAAQAIVGEHDFTSFAASDPDRATRSQPEPSQSAQQSPQQSNVRRIDSSHWSHAPLAAFPLINSLAGGGPANTPDVQLFTYFVRGNGFLHHMVRNLVGTFMEAGRHRITPAEVLDILNARDRSRAGPTAAASGLCLMKVLY